MRPDSLVNTQLSMQNTQFKFRKIRLMLCVLVLLVIGWSGFAQAADNKHLIVGGRVVESEAKYPFMASVYFYSTGSGLLDHICGGSLIADRWILTAAHCLYNRSFDRPVSSNRIWVRLGDTDLNSRDGFAIPALQIILHPDYDPVTVKNDIALIELSESYNGTQAVLPTKNSAIPSLGELGTVLGWGSLREGGTPTNKLREVALPVVSNLDCFPHYRETFDSRFAFCAGGTRVGGQDSCQGDSGGPILVSRDGANVVAGLVSHGNGCGRSGVPGVYTRVAAFTDWITSHATNAIEYAEPVNNTVTDQTVITRVFSNTAITGEITAGQVAYYDVTGAKQVNLTSITGDADLFIIDNADFDSISADSIQCVSENSTSLDICTIEDQSAVAFAVVYGHSLMSTYTLSSQQIQSGFGSVQILTTDGQPVSGEAGTSSSGGGAAVSFLLLLLIASIQRITLYRARSRKY